MDELARWRVSHGLSGLSVQWPAVSGVGMAAAMDERVKVDKSMSVDVATVKKVLKQLITASSLAGSVQAVLPRGLLMEGALPACVAPLTSSVKLRLDKPKSQAVNRSNMSGSKGSSGGGGGGGASKYSRMNPVERRKEIFNEVESTVKELLGLEDKVVDPEAALVDVGIDSLAGTQLVRELREKIGVDLEPTALFDYPSMNALADHLTSLIPDNSAGTSSVTVVSEPTKVQETTGVSFAKFKPDEEVQDDYFFDDDDDDDAAIGADAATVAASAEGKMAPVAGVSASVWSTLSPELRDRLQRAVEQAASKAAASIEKSESGRMRKVTEEFDDDEDDENEDVQGNKPPSLSKLSLSRSQNSGGLLAGSTASSASAGNLSPPRTLAASQSNPVSPPRNQSGAPVDRFGREPVAPPVYTAFSAAQQLCGAILSACLLALGVSFGVRVTFGATFWAPQISLLPRELVVFGWQLLAIPISLVSSGVGVCLITLMMKWLLLGKQVPCSMPMATHTYVRWWTVNIMIDVSNNFVLMPMRGTFVMVWWLRLLGAEIGENVIIDTFDIGDADLLVIGDGAVLQRDCVVRCSRVVPGECRIALEPVVIGRHCVIGPLVHVVPSFDASSHRVSRPVVPDGSKLHAMSSTERPVPISHDNGKNKNNNKQGSFSPLLKYRDQGVGLLILLLVHSFSLLPSAVLVRGVVTSAVSGGGGALQVIASAISIAIAFTWLPGCTYCVLLVIFKHLVIGKFIDNENQDSELPSIGNGPLFKSLMSCRFRFWLWSRLLNSSLYLGTLIPFSFTPVVPWYFRLLGASVGNNVWMVPPNSLVEFDLLTISNGCFSGGDYALFLTGDDGISHQMIWGEQSGVTDRAVCLSGTKLGSRSVVGDMTTVGGITPDNSVTVGDPNMRFPLPVSENDDMNLSNKKSSWKSIFISVGMMLAPLILGPGLLLPGIVLLMPGMLFLHNISHETAEAASCAPLSLADVSHFTIALVLVGSYFVIAFGSVWMATTLKRKLIGKIIESRHKFGSIYMLKWTALNFTIIPLIHRLFTKPLRGSPFFNSFLRLNGAKVGHHVHYMGVLEASADFDMLELNDRCCIDYNARLQAHEVINAHVSHRSIKIGERAHVGVRSNLLAGSSMLASSKLQDQSLLLGRSEPKPGQVWGGIPAALVKQPSALRSTNY
jgi:acetyltransferase-like isoleucine patch superfamily enzyme/acyl carrier protein